MSNPHNPRGYPQTLVASHPGNTNGAKHGIYSERMREPRAQQIAEQAMSAPWATSLDELGAVELGRIEALIEVLDSEIAKATDSTSLVTLCAMRLRASRRLTSLLDRMGMTPAARAEWAIQLGSDRGNVVRRLDRELVERLAEFEDDPASSQPS